MDVHGTPTFFVDKNFDIITMSETWLEDKDLSYKYELNDFNLLRHDRNENLNKTKGRYCLLGC